jgi:PKD repeat protein
VTTDAAGNAAFTVNVPGAVSSTYFVAATATRMVDHDADPATPLVARETSEFSQVRNPVALNSPPTANAGPDQTANEGATVTFNGTGSSDPDGDQLTYSWDFGDGATASGPTPSHAYADSGNYTATLTVADGKGGSHSDSLIVTVNNVTPTIGLSGNASVNEGAAYALSLGSVVDPGLDTVTSYRINWGDGVSENFAGSPNGLSHAYTYGDGSAAGTARTITIDLTDEDGTFSAVGAKTITVNNVAPTAVNDSAVTDEDQAVSIVVLGNDSDPAGALDPLQIISLTSGSKGTVSIDTKGTPQTTDDEIIYTPNAGATGGDSFTYTIGDGDGGSATGMVNVQIRNLVDVSGRSFDDKDNDGVFEPGDGEVGIGGVIVQLFNETSGALIATTTTAADGSFVFDVNLPAGTYKLVAAQPTGFLDGRETAGNLGGIVINGQDSDQITGIGVGAPGTTADAVDYLFAEILPSLAQGMVWHDADDDGQVDFGETAIAGATIELTGLDDRGVAVNRSVVTDTNGVYAFTDLRPSNAAGYTIRELQPAGFADGLDVLGTVNGVTVGNDAVNDVFSAVVLGRPGSLAENYNFGERVLSDGSVVAGQTATIGFWKKKNG